MARSKCLAILCLSSTAPTASAISAVPRSGLRLRATAAWMRARSRSVAASRSSRLRVRSAARSGLRQTISRSPGKSGLVMAAMSRWSNSESCKAPLFEQLLDRRGAQRGDPVEPGGLDVFGDARLGDHAAVADQDDMVEAEALLELLDLGGQRHRVGGVALEHLDRDGTAVGGAEQAIDDLQRALRAVTAVAALGERAAAAFHVARRHVVEHQRAVVEMALGQRRLDGGLALQQPVERGVELVLIDLAETEPVRQAGGGRGGGERARGGELGGGIEDAADEQGQDEVAAAVAVGAEDPVEADLARGAEGGGDMAMRQRADDGEGFALRGDDGAAFEHAAQALDMRRGPVGEVAEGALPDLAVFAIALAQQDGRGRVPVGDGFDIHGGVWAWPASGTSLKIEITWLRFGRLQPTLRVISTTSSQKPREARAREKQDRVRRRRRGPAAVRFMHGGSAEGRCGTNTKCSSALRRLSILPPRHVRLRRSAYAGLLPSGGRRRTASA